MISFDRKICNDHDAASSREWLETNGIGGFASGTISGTNTRRYHSVLTAAQDPPLGRVRLLSKFEETFVLGGRSVELSSNQFPGAVEPKGHEMLSSFRMNPFPVWTFEIDGIVLEKCLFMPHGLNTTYLRWTIAGAGHSDAELILRPLLSSVDYHGIRHESDGTSFGFEAKDGEVLVSASDTEVTCRLLHKGAEIIPTGYWYRDFEYAIEQERGFEHREDLYQPFELRFRLSQGAAEVTVTTEAGKIQEFAAARKAEIERRAELVRKSGARSDAGKQLVLAADQFVVKRGAGHTVVAGYPWFTDWGRDTMIALPGLTLATGRPEVAREILLEYSTHISEGMIPNRFPDEGSEADHNTVDATLWYFEAVRAFLASTKEYKFVRKNLYEKLAEILARHLYGTRYNIHVDTDGLLYAGSPDVQLTWMDAKVGDLVITPRTGKPVEVQALWYNALRTMESLAARFGDHEDEKRYRAMAELCSLSFNGSFWNRDEECLFDVVSNGESDPSIRPNQIFAVSLHHSMLDAERAAKVVARVEKDLLTPVGLRSLARSDPRYRPVYEGSPLERDSAYHQGTVWAWLIGPFVDAYRKVNPAGPVTERRITDITSELMSHLYEAGIGQISEIFDGDPPHRPRGCFAQAWSVAELLRVLGKK
ncbi:MAG: glycogen debranching enzyme family protein [Chloracidobacterium sp.]|nr:glycogen debranching enzyme family protein [Chloracidobacterium sp.]